MGGTAQLCSNKLIYKKFIIMEVPQVIEALIAAQNAQDNKSYSECFSETAIVHDEGKDYTGRQEIKKWIEEANNRYSTTLEAINFEDENQGSSVLTAKVTGRFPGSPAILHFHFVISDGLIQSLQITG